MITLKKILSDVDVISVTGSLEIWVSDICFDSRGVNYENVFVAMRGTRVDGHQYIPEVVAKGVRAVVCEELPAIQKENCCYVKVRDSLRALAIMSANFYDNPSGKIRLIGVTGTNGKTTIATLLYNLFTEMGFKCGLISTIQTVVAGSKGPATHTTPDPLQINRLLSEMVDTGCEYAFMEVSSHAVDQKRIDGLVFKGAIFTNLTHDHLDYHRTFKAYRDAKKQFFDNLPAEAFALVNADDRNGLVMIQNTVAKTFSYSLTTKADFRAKMLESHFTGNLMKIGNREFWTRLPGEFNAYNILAIYGAACLLGAEEEKIVQVISGLESADGRFQIIRSPSGWNAIVDYAHTPDALENVLETIRAIRSKGSRIITVVGAGGNRDRTKRPVMARVAADLSDRLILTSDNPRNEDPESIIDDMKAGLDKDQLSRALCITNRAEAIKTACTLAGKEDVILLAGKGHETYQDIKGIKHHFDDREEIKKFIKDS